MPGWDARSTQRGQRTPDVAEFRTMADGGTVTATPRFARTAADLLDKGEVKEALSLCLAGTQVFPRYATGHLVLGRCYDALGRSEEAMLEYRHAGEAFPDNPVIVGLYEAAKKKETAGYEEFAQAQAQTLEGWKDRLTFDEFLASKEEAPAQETTQAEEEAPVEIPSSSTEQPPVEEPPSSEVDQILQKLEEAPRRIAPSSDQPTPPPAPPPDAGTRFVTATLAEIYASQGEFNEAIDAYRKLAEQRPGSATRYLQRLAEIEKLKAAIDARRESPRSNAD
jgi:tetratricopeptide (TPR) repeat protein